MPVKSALVTGSAGFVGRHMVRELDARGWSVEGSDVRLGSAPPDHGNCRGFFGHETRQWSLGLHVRRFDLVVHCAAAEPHRAAIDGRPMNLATNLMLDAAMFDWAVRTGQGRVLYLSSSAAYPLRMQTSPNTGWGRLAEEYVNPGHVEQADAAYGWTKLTGERLAAAASDAGLPVHIVRPFSGFGEDQGEDWPFGAFAARARRRDDPFLIWGDGQQVRDWIHISDLVAGALAVVDADERRPVNLCTGVGTSMMQLVGLFCAQAGYYPEIELRGDKPAGVAYRVGDPARMAEIYKPVVSLEEGVRRALEA